MRRQRTTKELVLCYSLIDGSHIWVFRGFSRFSLDISYAVLQSGGGCVGASGRF